MENTDPVPPLEHKPEHPLRKIGVLLAWGLYGFWVALKWLFEGRRSLAWLAFFLVGGWISWEHRYQIAEEWGKLRGRYQGAMELEREQARRSGQVLKETQKELNSVK